MAISYEQLRSADLSSLSDAVDAWRPLPGQFDTIARAFGSTVTKGLRDSDWKGKRQQKRWRSSTLSRSR